MFDLFCWFVIWVCCIPGAIFWSLVLGTYIMRLAGAVNIEVIYKISHDDDSTSSVSGETDE